MRLGKWALLCDCRRDSMLLLAALPAVAGGAQQLEHGSQEVRPPGEDTRSAGSDHTYGDADCRPTRNYERCSSWEAEEREARPVQGAAVRGLPPVPYLGVCRALRPRVSCRGTCVLSVF